MARLSRQELCRELEARAGTYRGLRERLQRLLESCGAGRPCSTEHSLRLLEQKWDSVQAEAQERKVCGVGGSDPGGLPLPGPAQERREPISTSACPRPQERLAEGLTVSTEFHGSAQELLRWVAHAEELLASPAPPSFVLDSVTAQIQEHKARAGGALHGSGGPSGTCRDLPGLQVGSVPTALG